VKVGVVGAGAWGKNIVRTLSELDALGAIAETNPATRAQLHETYPGVPLVEGVEELVGLVDAVAVATPAEHHFSQAKTLLEAGLDVFVEKPITLDSGDARRLADLARARGRILMVGHLLLFQPAVKRLRDVIADGLIGRLTSIHQERLGLGRARPVENVLWSLGVHDVAVILGVTESSIESVAFVGQSVLTHGVDDDTYLHIDLSGGVQAHIHNSWIWPEKRRRLTAIGTQGMLVFDELAQTLTLHRKRIDAELRNVDEGEELLAVDPGQPLTLEMEHFIACCRERKTPLTHGDHAVEVIRVLEMATRQTVTT
jgi:predicted dehydrogenase